MPQMNADRNIQLRVRRDDFARLPPPLLVADQASATALTVTNTAQETLPLKTYTHYNGLLTNAAVAIYTNGGADRVARVAACTITNIDAGGAFTCTVYLTPATVAPATSNLILSVKSLAASSSYVLAELIGQLLTSGMSIQALCSTTLKIAIQLSIEETWL